MSIFRPAQHWNQSAAAFGVIEKTILPITMPMLPSPRRRTRPLPADGPHGALISSIETSALGRRSRMPCGKWMGKGGRGSATSCRLRCAVAWRRHPPHTQTRATADCRLTKTHGQVSKWVVREEDRNTCGDTLNAGSGSPVSACALGLMGY